MKPHVSRQRFWLRLGSCVLLSALFFQSSTEAQFPKRDTTAPAAQPEDPLGRITPRGTVLGFVVAAGNANYELAAQYLNTDLEPKAAAELAHQLAFVLDRRLPARLNNLSNDPEGSLTDTVDPRNELVGTIDSLGGKVDIIVERVNRGKGAPIWLFSRQTLGTIPDLFEEVNAISVENVLPEFFFERFLGFSVLAWVSLFIGFPLLYVLTLLLNRLLGVSAGFALRRLQKQPDRPNPTILPHPVRLLCMALILRWLLSQVSLPLLGRQFWTITIRVITIVGCVWLAMLASEVWEVHVKRRLERRRSTGTISLIRPARRIMDLVSITVGLFFFLFSFGINPTAALAGLGVGGIAVALAAQKTLENVIGGASIILDQAVKVGEYLKVGSIEGTVEEIGLRSTRVRTLDRTMVTIPNGQMASITLENFSARDRFWFHHVIGLRYETKALQLSSILDDIRALLVQNKRVAADSLRVRFFRFGPSSLDIELFAYVSARDWADFLRIQEELLLQIIDLIHQKGAEIAFPSQTVYFADRAGGDQVAKQPMSRAAPGGKGS